MPAVPLQVCFNAVLGGFARTPDVPGSGGTSRQVALVRNSAVESTVKLVPNIDKQFALVKSLISHKLKTMQGISFIIRHCTCSLSRSLSQSRTVRHIQKSSAAGPETLPKPRSGCRGSPWRQVQAKSYEFTGNCQCHSFRRVTVTGNE